MTRLDTLVRASASPPAAPYLLRDAKDAIDACFHLENQKKYCRTSARHVDITDPDARGYLVAGLLGESGELARALADNEDPATIINELADVLWSVTAIGIHIGVDLTTIAEALRAKMVARHTERMAAAGYTDCPGPILSPTPNL